MEKTSAITINLAKNRGESLVDRIVGFALTVGRVLIICTELIALGAFLYRFTLDRTLADLHDSITQQEAVVKLLHTNEVLFRNIQDRLHLASILIQQSNQLPNYLTTIQTFAPLDMTIHTIAVSPDAVRIQATVQSVDSLSTFVDKLRIYAPVKGVSIDRIDNQTETDTITVDITAVLKPSKNILLGIPIVQEGQ